VRAGTVDFDLQRLSERAVELLEGPVAEAVREGEISLDRVAELERLRARAEEALARGRAKRAKEAYSELVARAESALEASALADEARSLQSSVFQDLRRLERYRAVFERTYSEAVRGYEQAASALAAGDSAAAVEGFGAAVAVLGELEARAVSQVEDLMEAADAALERYELEASRSGYGEVLRIDPRHAGAARGIERVDALAEIGEEVRELEALEAGGRFEAALEALAGLERQYPDNPYITGKRAALEARIVERDFRDLLAAAGRAEGAGDFDAAIEALEQALELRPEAALGERIRELGGKRDAARLESLLASGYGDLSAGRYEEARERYREALALAPGNAEARTGLEKASSLYFASIRFRENLANAAKFSAEGRFPLAAKFFNDAMASRPVNLPESVEEREIRQELERQSTELPVTVRSDKRTYVSLIGVFPPERFREKDLRLFPDVYTLKCTRPGYREVEVTLKVNARKRSQEVEVVCEKKL
jgi:tetratricopeptide (TPR) repeat protein